MPDISRRKLAQLSREPRFLVQASVFLVIISLLISAVVARLRPEPTINPFTLSVEELDLFTVGKDIPKDLDIASLAGLIRNRSLFLGGALPRDYRDLRLFIDEEESTQLDQLKTSIENSSSVSDGERKLALLLLAAIHGSIAARNDTVATLESIPEGQRYRNEFLGDAYVSINEPEKGIAAYVREGETFSEATYSQRSSVIAYTGRKDQQRLREVLSKPGFRGAVTPRESIAAAKILGDFKQIFIDVIRIDLDLFKSPHLITALFTAAIWFVILVSMGSFSKGQILTGIAAFALGIFSGMLTLYVVILQNHYLNLEFHAGDTLVNQVIALVAGIGLREEFLKLICFLPVAIAIVKHRSATFALITAALTGLGFAMIENLQYFASTSNQFVAWNRLLSANALHFCLTGIVGFSLYKVLRNRGRGWENFLIDFLFVIAIHAVYDGFIMIPMLAEYSIVFLIVLALTAYRYLDLVRENMPTSGQLSRVSPLGVFVLGSALLACGIMVATSFSQNFLQSTGALAGAVGGSIPIAFAFISRLRDL